jgi:hypothetical protein
VATSFKDENKNKFCVPSIFAVYYIVESLMRNIKFY